MTSSAINAGLEHEIGPDGIVQVRLHAGELRLRAIDGNAVRVRDLEDRDLDERFEVVAGPGSVSIRPRATLGEVGLLLGGRRASRVEIELPRAATAVVETVSADVTATGMAGSQRYRTTSGTVRIDGPGSAIAVETVSGSLEIRCDGNLDLTARLVSGSAKIAASSIGKLVLTTTSGDVRVRGNLVGEGPFSVRTVSGEARLALAGDVRVEGRTLTGRIRSDRPHEATSRPGRQTVVIGGDGPLLSFESVSGGLRIVEPEPLLPPAPPRPPAPPALQSDDNEQRVDDHEAVRMDILRALERGEIDVVEATGRLEELDAGDDAVHRPRPFGASSDFGGRA